MSDAYPPQGVAYLGPITDTGRWANFQNRDDDIFICTPPKCGTTWTQAICAMLVFGTADHGIAPGAVSPWIDANFAPIDDYLKEVDSQPHRRFLKTHSPFDGIPYHPSCTYLAVFRDPRDAYLSGLNHRDNMNDQDLAESVFPSGADAFDNWLHAVREPGGWDVPSLDSIAHFFNSYWPYRELDNVHMFHYADMKRDLPGAISSMAQALGSTIDQTQLDAFTHAASFETMKGKAEQFAPESGTGMWKKETNFFANGSSEQWKDKLNADQLADFDARLAQLLPADEAHWLLNGEG